METTAPSNTYAGEEEHGEGKAAECWRNMAIEPKVASFNHLVAKPANIKINVIANEMQPKGFKPSISLGGGHQ